MEKTSKSQHMNLTTYVTGFLLSVMLTLAAYFTAVDGALAPRSIGIVVVGLAIAQLLVQLVFFLHLGRETKPRHQLLVFCFTLVVLAIVVYGSIWIMDNLNYNMMPHEMDEQLIEEEGIYR